MSQPSAQNTNPSKVKSGYLLLWAVLAFAAAGYMATLVLQPDWFAFPTAKHDTTVPESNQGQRAAAKALAEADQLRKRLQTMQDTVSKLHAQIGQLASREELTEARIATLEEQAAVAQIALERAKAAAKKPAKRVRTVKPRAKPTVRKAKRSTQAGAVPAKAKVTPALTLPRNWLHKIETGSLPTTIVPPEPPATRYAVRLTAGPSPDALRLSWSLLNERHRAVLGALKPRYRSAGTSAPTTSRYQLLAGPFRTAAEARRACQTLQARQVSCQPASFSGNAL